MSKAKLVLERFNKLNLVSEASKIDSLTSQRNKILDRMDALYSKIQSYSDSNKREAQLVKYYELQDKANQLASQISKLENQE